MAAPVVRGITFDKQLITSTNMAHIFYAMSGKQSGFTKGCVPSYSSGSTINITSGYPLVCGRFSQVTAGDLTAPSYGSTTICYTLVYTVDLSQTASKTSFSQGFFEFVAGGESTYPTLTQQDLDTNLTGKYQLPVAQFKVTSSGLTDFTDVRNVFEGSTLVTVPSSAWTGSGPYTAEVAVSSMIGDPAPSWSVEVPDGTTDIVGQEMLEGASCIGRVWTTTGVLHLMAYGDTPTTVLYIRVKE